MKKVVFLLLVLSVFSVAKTAKMHSKSDAPAVEKIDEEVAAETVEKTTAVPSMHDDASVVDSTFTVYIHPFNFLVPYSPFWSGFIPLKGITFYPSINLTFEWKLYEKSSLVTMPHFVRIDRLDDGYKIRDIGLQESLRWYGIQGNRWLYFQAGILLSRLHVQTDDDGGFGGWLYGFMCNGGLKKILNGGEGFFGRFAVSVDIGMGYAWTSDFTADRKRAWLKLDKGFVIDLNAAVGFQI